MLSDDSEGITLESLGGVFIATLVGLGKSRFLLSNSLSSCAIGNKLFTLQCPWHSAVIAMFVLVGEVYYYKRKTRKEKEVELSKPATFATKIQPFDNFEYSEKVLNNSVLLGTGSFVPVSKKQQRFSLYPRD